MPRPGHLLQSYWTSSRAVTSLGSAETDCNRLWQRAARFKVMGCAGSVPVEPAAAPGAKAGGAAEPTPEEQAAPTAPIRQAADEPKAEPTSWPPMSVVLDGETYTVCEKDGVAERIGNGVWADVFKGIGPTGDEVALKMLRELPKRNREGTVPPRNETEQRAEFYNECALHGFAYRLAEAEGSICARVPKLIAFSETVAAIELVRGQTLEVFLRQRRMCDVAMGPAVAKLCRIVLRKVRFSP